MKKIALSLLLIIVVASLVIYFLTEDEQKEMDPARFLPKQTSFYLEHQDLEVFIDSLSQSKLGKTFSAIDYDLLFRELQLHELHYENFKNIRDDINEFLDSQVYKQLLSKKVVVSLLPAESAEISDPQVEAKKRLLVIFKTKLNSNLLDLIGYLNLEGIRQTSQKYGNHVIKFHHLKNNEILVTTKVEGLVLLSFNEDIIRASIDRFERKESSLVSHKDFKELRKNQRNCKVFFYSSIQEIRKQLPYFIQKFDDTTKDIITKKLIGWDGWRTFSFCITSDGNALYDRATIYFDKDKLDPSTKKLFLTPPEENKTLSMIPASVVTYYWTNTFDLPVIWDTIINNSKMSEEQRSKIRNDFIKNIGMEPEKLFELFNKKIAFFIMEGNGANFIPLPDISFIINLKQSKEVGDLLKNQLEKFQIPVQTQTYKKRKMIYWGNSIQQSLQPVYAIFNSHLYVSSSIEVMKKMIDTIDSGQGLAVDNEFLSVTHSNFTGKNNTVSFIRFSSLIRLTKELVNWGGTILGLQDRRVAHKTKILIEHLINPVLDGMMMFSTVHARSYTTDDKIVFENKTIFDRTQP